MKAEDRLRIERHGGAAAPELLERYAFRVTGTVLGTMRGHVSVDPVAKQYIPQIHELESRPDEMADPIGDEAHSPVKGIVHRYPDRVLLKSISVCPVYCRYCFRREMVGPKNGEPLSAAEQKAALDYIRRHPEIYEVILTGGDPLMLSARRLDVLMRALEAIPHVQVIRLHTRVPVADPPRVTADVCAALESTGKAVYVALHINHAQEMSDAGRMAIKNLRRAGVSLLSQSVLLKGVNDDVQALEDLYRLLVSLHVKPYYLHHPDRAPGTSHFRLSIEEGQAIVAQLRGRLSGLCQPTYMLDIPGGYGKIPLTPVYAKKLANNGYFLTDWQGKSHVYKE